MATRFRAPWIRILRPERIHRVTMTPGQVCWTLLIVSSKKRDWGFWASPTSWIGVKEYVKSDTSRRSKGLLMPTPGRRKKKPPEALRSRRVLLNLTEEEFEKLDKAASGGKGIQRHPSQGDHHGST